MSFLPEGTWTGHYPAVSHPSGPDVRLALEFSHRSADSEPGQPNIEIAQRLELAQDESFLPVFASLSIVRALEYMRSDIEVAEIFEGPSAKGLNENTGTWGELSQAKTLMQSYECSRPEILTSGYNIGNVVIQAHALGLDPLVPNNLPRSFDSQSDQPWTRNRALWTILAVPRIYKLRKNGH